MFSEKTVKNSFGDSFDSLLGKGGVLRQKLTYFLLFSSFFKKSCNFLRKQQKTVSGCLVSFEGKEASGDENDLTFFMENEVLNIFSCNNFFPKSNIFGGKGEKNFGGTLPFFRRRGHLS